MEFLCGKIDSANSQFEQLLIASNRESSDKIINYIHARIQTNTHTHKHIYGNDIILKPIVFSQTI